MREGGAASACLLDTLIAVVGSVSCYIPRVLVQSKCQSTNCLSLLHEDCQTLTGLQFCVQYFAMP